MRKIFILLFSISILTTPFITSCSSKKHHVSSVDKRKKQLAKKKKRKPNDCPKLDCD